MKEAEGRLEIRKDERMNGGRKKVIKREAKG